MKSKILIIITNLLLALSLQANECTFDDMKLDKDIVFGFFNGVQTTKKQAKNALRLIQTKFISSSTTYKGESIEYVLFYNKTEGLSDFAETFEQRAEEHAPILADKYENFWRMQRTGDNEWEQIKNTISGAKELGKAVIDAKLANAISSITNLLLKSKTTSLMYENHRAKLDCIEVRNKKLLIFAHSQGNLFAVEAYDHIVPKMTDKAVDLIHVAPASPMLREANSATVYFLEDLDFVINPLRMTGHVPLVTHTMSNYFLRPPGLNEGRDFMGHGLLEIYLNPWITVSADIKSAIDTSFDTLAYPHPDSHEDNTSDGVDSETFDYQSSCTDIHFPDDVQSYDGVIKAVIDLHSHGTNEEICRAIKSELEEMGVDTSTSPDLDTDNSDSTDDPDTTPPTDPADFDYQSICSQSVDFPDPIPSELEETFDGILQGNTLTQEVICPLLQASITAYDLANGGGISIP